MRKSLVLLLSVLASSWVVVATAQDDGAPSPELDEDTQQCVRAFNDAQRLRREGRLRASRDQLVVCAQSDCPTLLKDKCIPWLTDVESAIPTVIVVAKDPQGKDTTTVRVVMDGIALAEELEGRSLAVDPGAHEFRFENREALSIVQQLVIVEGEKGRRIDLQFELPPDDPPPPDPPPPPLPAARPSDTATTDLSPVIWAGVVFGALGITVGTITGVIAFAEADNLDDTCADDVCPQSARADYDTGLAYANASTASFIIGGAGVALAVGVYLLEDDDDVQVVVGPSGIVGRF
jgi:hypothetical protein